MRERDVALCLSMPRVNALFSLQMFPQFFFCLQVTASAIYATALPYTQSRRFEEWFIFLDVFDIVFHLAFL